MNCAEVLTILRITSVPVYTLGVVKQSYLSVKGSNEAHQSTGFTTKPLLNHTHRGRMAWQVSSSYNQRSRGETQMGRWKMVIGPKLKARSFPNQKTEANIGTHVLNKMTALGRPESR